MHRSRHSRLPASLRILVLVVFALGLVVQPVLASVGEMHELAHDPSGMHSHAEHSDDVVAELASIGEQDQDGTATLHVLLHFAHCCGQATAAMLPSAKIAAMAPATELAIAQAQIVSQTRLCAPFRPPITA